ncbi:staphylopine family metallophore export MFS transporter CntE [Paenibacillus sedimenti]|uniref:MFS transporter n=1 Tax=Paenibacillus sedimenti TaxID=2770274 RepID=A0A926QJB4_9BACL|nr:MFS transporter [Paenibacillus sedimenti]MBD0381385.1 MFS transporter [Paenibacillus sedimenti]
MNITQQPAMVAKDTPFGSKAIQIYLISILFYTTSHALLILLPLNSHALGASPAQIGMIMGAYMFTSMFLRPVAGKIVDRLGYRRIFTGALILNVVVISMYLIHELWVFAILRMAQGVILSFVSMVLHLMIIEVLPEKARGQGLSLFSLSSMLPYTYGPFFVVYFTDIVPMSYIFLALIPLSVMTLLIGLNVKLPEIRRDAQPPNANPHDTESYRGWADPKLLFPSVTMLLASAIIGTVAAFLPLYLANRELPYAGLYFFAETVVLITLRFFGRKMIPTNGRFPFRMVIVLICLITTAVGLVRMAESMPVILIAAVCNGIALSMLYPTLLTYVSFVVPERFRGRGIGLFIAAADFGTSVGTWALSLVANAYSYEAMFSGCMAIGAVTLLYILLLANKQGVRT